MATKLVIRHGQAHGVYDDRWRPLLEALGVMQVERASEVEFDAVSGDWVAELKTTGQEIGRGKDRSQVIRQEVEYLERRL